MVSTTKTTTGRDRRYNPKEFEQQWRDAWQDANLYRFDPFSKAPKWYAVTMYPYPSGDLHIGHWYAMAPSDAAARYRRMQGYNVFFPMGFDAFGLPAENAAIKHNIHPYKWTMANIENMRRQLRTMGAMFDWNQEVITCTPNYYKWNQWLFLQFYKNDLAYQATAAVWWCPNCQTVLANEQVIEGHCERCGAEVYRRELEQWFFRITDYADELLNFDGIEWPEPVKIMQQNWIGRSEGASVTFETEQGDQIRVFTTRPDTLWGATFMVLAPEHPLVNKLTTDEQRDAVNEYIERTSHESEIQRQSTATEKTGVFTGGYAVNPVNGDRIPVWIGDYVLMSYGTGAVMAVPAHDERDFAFAIKYGLPIVPVIERLDGVTRSLARFDALEEEAAFEIALNETGIEHERGEEGFEIALTRDTVDDYLDIASKHVTDDGAIGYAGARNGFAFINEIVELDSLESDRNIASYTGNAYPTAMAALYREPYYRDIVFHADYGTMMSSGELSGTSGEEAIPATIRWLEERDIGTGEVTYRLRDWLISRQRYWGTPIPIIYCDQCGVVPVPEEDLPVKLPEDSEFQPTGESPLKTDEEFINVACPSCGGPARRETDTMDTFVDSSWYQYRYLSPDDDDYPFDRDLTERWMPVDQYTGGIEHAVMHLLYTRFFTKAMRDLGMVSIDEPFVRLANQGIVLGEDSEKMSKSRGNVVDPDELVDQMGSDTVRLFLMFMRPWNQGGPWDSMGITGIQRFLDRAFTVVVETLDNPAEVIDNDDTRRLRRITHQTIREVSDDLETFGLNTMIARLMEFVNELMKLKDTDVASTAAWKEATRMLALMLAPSAPHLAEELWNRMGYEFSIHQQSWPQWDEALAAEESIELVVQVNGKVRGRVSVPPDSDQDTALTAARDDERIAGHLDGKEVVKEVYVPGRLINFVVK